MGKKKKVRLGSIDSSGFEARHVSQYFLQRTERNKPIYARFHPKMTIVCDCSSHMIVGLHATRGPKPDNRQLKPALNNTVMKIDKLLGDAGFDGESNHKYCRETKKIRSFFPPLIGRPTKQGKLSGYWRSKMRHYFKDTEPISYGQRWQVETTFSMIKRCFTSALSAKSYHGRIRQMFLLALTHNIAILLLIGFLQSMSVPIIPGW